MNINNLNLKVRRTESHDFEISTFRFLREAIPATVCCDVVIGKQSILSTILPSLQARPRARPNTVMALLIHHVLLSVLHDRT